jgi:predicted  nucleic acid-binding Zn-ribbon protein
MVRCTHCHFLFEPATTGLLPACLQCGGDTTVVLKIEPFEDELSSPPTMKIPALKVGVGQ